MTGEVPDAEAADLARRATAVHEAAHAIVALLHGLPVRRAVLIETGGGFVTLLDPLVELEAVELTTARLAADDVTQRPVRVPRAWDVPAVVVMLLAGEAASARVLGRHTDGGWVDRYEAEHVLGQALHRPPWGAEVQCLIAGVMRAAEATVRHQWRWIEATAAALLERRVLSVDEVRALKPGKDR